MKYNFDEITDRTGTYSIKHDLVGRGKPIDAIPLWVADMDIKAPPCVREALSDFSLNQGIFGYSEPDSAYFETLSNWFTTRHNWTPEPEWLVVTPGVVTALYLAISAYTKPGESVLIQQPVYPPFASSVHDTKRTLVVNELLLDEETGTYSIDYEDFEAKIRANDIKLFILCSPHNPVGRVWKPEELLRIGEICKANNVLIIADEIHCDLVYPGFKHTVFESLSPEFRDITITCTAPSKTFNLAGLQTSNLFIPDEKLRKDFLRAYAAFGLSQKPITGLIACKAAYRGGGEWYEQFIDYLDGTVSFMSSFAEKTPGLKIKKPEGTYLIWLDFRELGLTNAQLDDLIINKAKVWLNSGHTFGAGGSGFMRLNAAAPRITVKTALNRIAGVL
jgi:cystathionine beta-lyase